MPSSTPVLEGVLAINKPAGVTSAQLLRDLQRDHFDASPLFAPWFAAERAKRAADGQTKYTRRRDRKRLQLKLGHGGTLDPMATGVLIVGVGKGTKTLQSYLECTKTYEAVVLFGASSDTYDNTGKVVQRAGIEGVTEETVTDALKRFRGRILQRPPVYSALRINGKRAYDIARSGGPLPEMKEREVTCEAIEMIEWLDAGTHGYKLPESEVSAEEKKAVAAVQAASTGGTDTAKRKLTEDVDGRSNIPTKRLKANEASVENDEQLDGESMITSSQAQEDSISAEERLELQEQDETSRRESEESQKLPVETEEPAPKGQDGEHLMSGALQPEAEKPPKSRGHTSPPTLRIGTPAARIRMTVSSGFYVRSLCHDLGEAVGSAAMMAALVRSRQGEFELGSNVLEWEDLDKGEAVWGPQVQSMLQSWLDKDPKSDD